MIIALRCNCGGGTYALWCGGMCQWNKLAGGGGGEERGRMRSFCSAVGVFMFLSLSEPVGFPRCPRPQRASEKLNGPQLNVFESASAGACSSHTPSPPRIESPCANNPSVVASKHGPDPSQVPQRCPRLWVSQVPHTPRHHLLHALTGEYTPLAGLSSPPSALMALSTC